MSEHTQANKYYREEGISSDAFSHLPGSSLNTIYRLVQEGNNAASVCGPVMPCGAQTGLQFHYCFLKKLSLRIRLSGEAKPSEAEFNVLIKMLKRLYS